MYIAVSAGDVSLVDVDIFSDLHVEFRDVVDADAGRLLADSGAGRLDGEHAWLEVKWLRQHGSDDRGWPDAFDAMIDYARGKGWLSPDGQQVRAHVARPDGSQPVR